MDADERRFFIFLKAFIGLEIICVHLRLSAVSLNCPHNSLPACVTLCNWEGRRKSIGSGGRASYYSR